jgi:hypothetical protein
MTVRWIMAVLLTIAALPAGAQEEWRSLFNGQNLDGWIQLNGDAR